MAYRALDGEGSGSTSDIRSAIDRADREGADILVMSLGAPLYSPALADELRRALSDDGNVTAAFVAVGNSYPLRVASPGDVPPVIGVSATNAVPASEAKRAYFAQTGPDTGIDGSGGATRGVNPDTAAPGMQVETPIWSAPKANGGTETTSRLSGTSMATPVAGGVGALVLDARPGLRGDADEFHRVIVDSGQPTPLLGLTESRGGMVNASRAINGYETAAPKRDLPAETEGRDAAHEALAGQFGRFVSGFSDGIGDILNVGA
jgi:subtilisin family serine protease